MKISKKNSNNISLLEAVSEASKKGVRLTKPSIIKYAIEEGFGKKFISKWVINKKEFLKFIDAGLYR